jgi:peptidoglycan/LPS O-acetylase OafA/YrhL
VAVYLVVAFHAGVDRLSGGFIGVDVFFVLSGYLVTQLLLRDLDQGGRIQLRRFYARRFRRLLPAAVVVLLATAIVFPGIGAPTDLADAEGALRAASLYVANWFFIHQASDYFARTIDSSPVVHFWSLSVEEQFYLAWPLLLGGVYALARRARERAWTVVRAAVGVGLVLSLLNALRLAGAELSRAYYGTDTRAYQLMAGALLALSPSLLAALRSPRLGRLLSLGAAGALAGLVVASTSLLELGPITRGVVATVLTVTLIASLDAKGGLARSVLSLPPIVYLGRISYGIYLWHWLVIVVTVRTFELNPLSTAAVAVLIASGLAALSYQLLELPVRESRWLDQRRVRVIVAGLATSVLVGVAVTPRLLDRDGSAVPDDVVVAGGSSVSGGTPIPDDLDWQGAAADHGEFPACTAAAPARCTLVRGTGTHILLMGDSNARMYIPALKKLAEDRSLTLSVAVAPGCPWQRGILRRGEGLVGDKVQDLGPPCQAHHDEWYDTVIPALDPDVIVVANQPWDDPTSVRQIQDEERGAVEVGTSAFLDVVRTRTSEAVRALRADDRRVVMLEPVPLSSDKDDPLACLSEARFLEECRFVSRMAPTGVETTYREIASEQPDAVISVDLDREVCPYLPICDPIVNHLIVRWDPQHLTARFATTLEVPFEAILDAKHLIS